MTLIVFWKLKRQFCYEHFFIKKNKDKGVNMEMNGYSIIGLISLGIFFLFY